MGLKNDLVARVAEIFKEQWQARDGQTVPDADDLKLTNDAVKLDGVVLYADMSARVMKTLYQFTPDVEIYSIDEAFLSLKGFEHLNLTDYGKKIQKTLMQWTGIPVSTYG